MSKVGRQTSQPLTAPVRDHLARKRQQQFKFTKEEQAVAKAIFEAKYPDARWENLHPNRSMRLARLIEARAAVAALDKMRSKRK